MESNLEFIKTLAETLSSELDSLSVDEEISVEDGKFNLEEKVREFEIKLIKAALVKTDGHQGRAAKLLGVPTSTLNNKIKIHGIEYLKSVEPRVYFK